VIPKQLHYVWLSDDPLPELMGRCRKSWEEWLPGYEWIRWDKKKVQTIDNQWLNQCISIKNYAFATDFIRVYALYHFGGIYLDADVELTSSLDPFLKHRFFIGSEFNDDLEPALFGSVAGHPLLRELLDYYGHRSFIKENGKFDLRPLPFIFNQEATKYGFRANGRAQSLKEGIEVYPCEYFSPKNLYFENFKTTQENVAIHHLTSSWVRKGWKHSIKILFHQLLFIIGGKRFHSRVIVLIRNI
jgi:hypothetical protein